MARLLAELVEGFAAPTLDRTRWDASTSGVFRDPAMARGQVPITGAYEQLGTSGWDARGGMVSARIQIPDPADTTGSVEVFLTVQASAVTGGTANQAQMYVSGSGMTAAVKVAGTNVTHALPTYSPAAHAYWRIAHTGTAFTFATSPDGARWTVHWTQASAWDPLDVDVSLSAGHWDTEADGLYASLSEINTPPRWSVGADWIVRAEVRPAEGGVNCIVDYAGGGAGAVTNWVTNPSAETNLTGITTAATGGTPTITRSSARAQFGTFSVQYAYGASQGVTQALTTWALDSPGLSGPGPVTASVWAYLPAGMGTVWTWAGLWTGSAWITGGPMVPVVAAGWTRLTRTLVLPDGAVASSVGWQLVADFSSRTVNLDGCMTEPGEVAHAYVDGSQMGCTWTGTAHASRSQRAVTVDAVTLYRIAPGMAPVEVRAGRRVAAPGGTTGVIEDREAPLGVPVQYRARGLAGSTVLNLSAPVTVTVPPPTDLRVMWFKNPGRPADSIPLRVAAGAPTESHEPRANEHQVIGDPLPRVLYDVRSAPSWSAIRVYTDTQAEADRLRRLVAPGATLLLQPQPGWPILPEMYAQVGTMQGASLTGIATDPHMVWELPVRQVGSPVGGVVGVGGITWADVIGLYPTWDALIADNPTWEHLYTRPSGG